MSKEDILPFEDFRLPPIGHAVSGAVGSSIANLFIYPLDISTTRLQLKKDDEKKQSIIETIKTIYEKEGGFKGLYAGLGVDTVATILSSFIYFYCYTALRNVQEKLNINMGKSSAQLNVAQELFLGAEAALISRFFTTPVSNVTTRLQTAGHNKKGFKDIAMEILNEKGVTGFWTGKKGRRGNIDVTFAKNAVIIGYRASIALVSNPSITYFVFEKIKSTYMRTQKKSSLTGLQVFLFSAIAKSFATMITYPFIFLRTRMIGGENKQQQGMMATFKAVVKKDGYLGLYKGMQAQITKGFFNQGIMYMIKDYVATYLALVFYHSYKLKMRAKLAQ